jgi:hypothetical protein
MATKVGLHPTEPLDAALGVVKTIILLIFGYRGIAQIAESARYPEGTDPDGSAGIGVLIESWFSAVGLCFKLRQLLLQLSAIQLLIALLIEWFDGSRIGPLILSGYDRCRDQQQQEQLQNVGLKFHSTAP